ncbi:MAG: sigma-70 family RNA polymerase sigma factor [Hyphomonadaceae bacterium]|nr:sigma-70 family RNA polymerase sigma factor [Hyphomonadaceae bacterium]
MPYSDVSHADDLDDIRAAAAGNRLAQSALVTRHMPRVYGLAYRMLRDTALAEDITQEAFLRAWKVLPGWEPRAKFSTWLHQVTLNLCRDHYRKKREQIMEELPERVDPDLRPEDRLDQTQRTEWIMTAIDTLPDRQKEALILCALEGHTNISAAEVMGVSVEAIESLLSRGRRKLKGLMKEQTRGTGT